LENENLGPLESRVMEHLWRAGPSTVAETRSALNRKRPRLAYTTVMTILFRLYQKGYVTRAREGRLFRYAAAFDEPSLPGAIGRRELQRLIERHGAETLAGFAADLAGVNSELAARLRALAQKRSKGRR
jgi:predicted transcriptional regulator